MSTITEKLEKCGICLEEHNQKDMAQLLPCKHLFDAACIEQWHRSNHDDCPLCRQVVTHLNVNLNVNGVIQSVARPVIAAAAANAAMVEWPMVANPIQVRVEPFGYLIRGLSPTDRRHATVYHIIEAIQNYSGLRFDGTNMLVFFRGAAVLMAASRGDIQEMNDFLSDGSISDGFRERALIGAAGNGYLNAVNILLANGVISEHLRSEARTLAQQNGYQEIAEVLGLREQQLRRQSNFRLSLVAGFGIALLGSLVHQVAVRFFN